MKNESKKTDKTNTNVITYIIVFYVFFLIHLNMKKISDDVIFSHMLDDTALIELLKHIYFNSTGRVITDGMGVIVNYMPFIWFLIINSLIFTLDTFSMSYLFCESKNNRIVAILATLLFPINLLSSAGYIATSTNYLWPASAILLSLSIFKKSENQKLKPIEYVLYIISLLYAGGQEQSVAISFIAFVLLFLFRRKKINIPIWILGFTILIISLCFLLTSPGRMGRGDIYNVFVIPNYAQLDLLDKLHLGFSTTISHYLSIQCIIFILFACLLFYSVWNATKRTAYRIIAIYPLFYIWFVEIIQRNTLSDLGNYFQYYYDWSCGQPAFPLLDAGNFRDIKTYIPFIMALLLVISILFCFGLLRNSVLLYTVMTLGFASRMIMSFSPSLFGSGNRTFIYLYIALIGICTILANDLYKEHKKAILFIMFPCAILNTVQSILFLTSIV